jgi:hypothetical protein
LVGTKGKLKVDQLAVLMGRLMVEKLVVVKVEKKE